MYLNINMVNIIVYLLFIVDIFKALNTFKHKKKGNRFLINAKSIDYANA